jgi:hypothetical protein
MSRIPVTIKINKETYIHGRLRFEISLRIDPLFLSKIGR